MARPLTQLSPRWCAADGVRVGFSFECPCCEGTERATRLFIATHHKGHEFEEDRMIRPHLSPDAPIWTIDGDTFDTITVNPSVDASKHGHWHGFIVNGVAN